MFFFSVSDSRCGAASSSSWTEADQKACGAASRVKRAHRPPGRLWFKTLAGFSFNSKQKKSQNKKKERSFAKATQKENHTKKNCIRNWFFLFFFGEIRKEPFPKKKPKRRKKLKIISLIVHVIYIIISSCAEKVFLFLLLEVLIFKLSLFFNQKKIK